MPLVKTMFVKKYPKDTAATIFAWIADEGSAVFVTVTKKWIDRLVGRQRCSEGFSSTFTGRR